MDGRPRPSTSAPRVAEFLDATPLFADCDISVAEKIATHVEVALFGAGSPLVAVGSDRSGIGFLTKGRASVSAFNVDTAQATVLYELGVGDCFGETAALLKHPQHHQVLALEDCQVIQLGADAFEQLVTRIPAFSAALSRLVAKRLVEASDVAARPVAPQAEPTPPIAEPLTPPTADQTLRFVSVGDFENVPRAVDLVPQTLIHQHRMLPLAISGSRVTVGMVDPLDRGAIRELTRVLQKVEPSIVAISADDFQNAVRRFRLDTPVGHARGGRIPASAVVFEEVESEREGAQNLRAAGDQIVKLASEVVAAGLERHASDIHIENDASAVRIRFRVNGTLSDWGHEVPAYMGRAVIARFKVLAGVDITERRRPQDGRVGVRVGNRDVDLRVSTLPASTGEKLVMRVFEASQMLRGPEQIFVERRTLEAVRNALERPYGAIIVAGPTGSGKSSTLYAALHERQRTRPDTNILTVEDPVEYRIAGVTQVQVNHAIDLGFAKILRAMLRQDPDVVMVGEVRDSETAQLALEAAMTGHLMLTSLHANNATAVIQRLENLGCNRSVIAQSLALVLVQRLARRLCPECTTTEAAPPLLVDTLASRRLFDPANPVPLPRAPGCEACEHTGLGGRIAVVESLVLDDEVRATLMAGRPLSDVVEAATARRGVLRFYQYARHLMQQKIISPAEALLTVAI